MTTSSTDDARSQELQKKLSADQDNVDTDASSDSGAQDKDCEKRSPFRGMRPGRKGDPRMHAAVKARLANPDLSPLDALREGGFDYPENVTDAHILENDTVSLAQHKNQLSRRCRLAREQAQTDRLARQTANAAFLSDFERQAELDRIAAADELHNLAYSAPRQRKRGMALRDDIVLMEKMDAQEQIRRESIARQRMMASQYYPASNPFHAPPPYGLPGSIPDRSLPASFRTVPQSFVMRHDVPPISRFQRPSLTAQDPLAGTLQARGPPVGPSLTAPSTSFALPQSLLNVLEPRPSSYTSAAAAPSNPSASAASQTRNGQRPTSSGRLVAPARSTASTLFEVLSHTQQPPASAALPANKDASVVEQLTAALSSTTRLADMLGDLPLPNQKYDVALNLYRTECNKLYNRCMILAGFTPEEAQEMTLNYRLMALRAWSDEGKRLGQDNALMERLLASKGSMGPSRPMMR